MFKFVLIASLLCCVAFAAPLTDEEEKFEQERIQNESAQYNFGSKVTDDINDAKIERSETRDGSKVSGNYSYSDGYVMRTVYYEADENGYRVVKEETQNIGDGPVYNPDGQADIENSVGTNYQIKLDTSDEKKHYKDINA